MKSLYYTIFLQFRLFAVIDKYHILCYNKHIRKSTKFLYNSADMSKIMPRRRTKIVCTLGPSTNTESAIEKLAKNGMNIARINVSHGTQEQHAETIRILKKLNASGAYCIGILIDTKGAEIRTEERKEALEIAEGEQVIFSPTSVESDKKVIVVNYDRFSSDVRETDRILLDNGELSFAINEIRDDGTVLATANEAGKIGSRRHVNLPGADIDLPSISKRDWEDIAFAVKQNVDFLALSFIRTAEEVQTVRDYLDKNDSNIFIVSKIETKKAVDNLGEIIEVSDGIMIARGDLGADVPFEDLAVIQKEATQRCRDAGKPVIVATHMLESMIEHPMPTRAEVTDVAYAGESEVDATMLSGETASGKHPFKAVNAMDRILRKIEEYVCRFPKRLETAIHNERESRAEATVYLADTSKADAILVFTKTGQTAQDVSKFRPKVPIIAMAPTEEVQRRIQLLYGVFPYVIPFGESEHTVEMAIEEAKNAGMVQKGQRLVLVSDVQAKDSPVSSIQVRTVS